MTYARQVRRKLDMELGTHNNPHGAEDESSSSMEAIKKGEAKTSDSRHPVEAARMSTLSEDDSKFFFRQMEQNLKAMEAKFQHRNEEIAALQKRKNHLAEAILMTDSGIDEGGSASSKRHSAAFRRSTSHGVSAAAGMERIERRASKREALKIALREKLPKKIASLSKDFKMKMKSVGKGSKSKETEDQSHGDE